MIEAVDAVDFGALRKELLRMLVAMMVGLLFAACARPSYLGANVPAPCTGNDAEGCLGWMVERDLGAAELDIYDDAALRAYVQGVAERLAEGSTLAHAPRIVVVNRDGTYATSGSRIVIGRPTIERLASEAQLAGVIAHELAHVEGHHASVSLFGPPADDEWLGQRRDAEAIADERAVALLEHAGYAPSAMESALRAVLDSEDEEHPLRADRIDHVAHLAAGRGGFEGSAELLRHIDHMVVGRDSRLGRRIDDAWVVAALGIALDIEGNDVVKSADDLFVVRRGHASIAAYAIGAPWARELAETLDDRQTQERDVGTITIGTVGRGAPRDDSPLGKLAHAIRNTLPQPSPGTRIAIVERPRGALVIELGGHEVPQLGLRAATADELAAAEPLRIAVELAPATGRIARLGVCEGRLLDDKRREVAAGDPIKCADRTFDDDDQLAAR